MENVIPYGPRTNSEALDGIRHSDGNDSAARRAVCKIKMRAKHKQAFTKCGITCACALDLTDEGGPWRPPRTPKF